MEVPNEITEASIFVVNPELNQTSAYQISVVPVNALPAGASLLVKLPPELSLLSP